MMTRITQNYIKKSLVLLMIILWGSGAMSQTPTTFSYTGSVQTYTVPAGVTEIKIEAYGAKGADHGNSSGGLGGYISGEVSVTPGEVLSIYVGGTSGYNGGGAAGGGTGGSALSGENGGGASDVRQGGNTFANRVVVAGGGGGAGRATCDNNDGGGGGYPGGFGGKSSNEAANTGGTGTATAGGNSGVGSCSGDCSCSPGGGGGGGGNGGGAGGNYGVFGGTNTIGGTGGACGQGGSAHDGPGGLNAAGNGGCFGFGGDGGINTRGGGGGGGGWYGGGAGGGNWGSGGGGGSSYVIPTAANLTFTNNIRNGNGEIIITPLCIGLTVSVSDTSLCPGESLTLSASSTVGGNVTWDNGVVSGVAFIPPVGTTTYTATSDSVSDCSFSIDITVNALPTVVANSDANSICLGNPVVLYGSGAASYTWDNSVTDSVSYTPASAGTKSYTVTGTDTNGCSNTASINITVSSPIPVTDTVISCGDFTWINGVTYTQNNTTASDTFTNIAGCDSIVILNLTILRNGSKTVTNSNDNGPGSLRDLVSTSCSGDTIVFDASTNGNPILLTSGQIIIDKNIVIMGVDSSLSLIDGSNLGRIFYIYPKVTLSISKVKLQNGQTKEGGAIYNRGNLILNEVSFKSNKAEISNNGHTKGGAIYNKGRMTITNSSFICNSAIAKQNSNSYGGAIYNGRKGSCVMTNCVATGNCVASFHGLVLGGVIYNGVDANFDLSNSLMSGNKANTDYYGYGGAIVNRRGVTSTINNCSLIDNYAFSTGGAIHNLHFPNTITLTNVILKGNKVENGMNDVGQGAFTYR